MRVDASDSSPPTRPGTGPETGPDAVEPAPPDGGGGPADGGAPGREITCDICVIGAGSGGLTIAAGASQMGADTVLIEAAEMGGDCLNTGCVPSKALIAAAAAAQARRESGPFGIQADAPEIDPAVVHAHVQGIIGAIAPHDSQARFEGLGVRVIRERARFTGPRQLVTDSHRIRARRYVIATGSRPAIPPVPGIEDVPYLTNETIFDLAERPEHLIVLGGGPIGTELAQAHRRLGARVTVIEMDRLLPRDDPEAAEILHRRLTAEGVEVREHARAARIEARAGGVRVELEAVAPGGQAAAASPPEAVEGSHLLVATGRAATLDDLGLEAAGIAYDRGGVTVDRRLRSSDRKVFAVGDAAGGPQFTHVAGYHGGIVLRNALFRLPAKVDYAALPRVTYTDPELAQIGLTESEARKKGHEIRLLRAPFADNDRAIAERAGTGFAKIVVTPRGRILGATLIGPHAGELCQIWGLAISAGLKIGKIAGMMAPYPTLGEISKAAAGSFYTDKLFSQRTRRLVRLLARLG